MTYYGELPDAEIHRRIREILSFAVAHLPADDYADRLAEGDQIRMHPGGELTRFTWGHDYAGAPKDLFLCATGALLAEEWVFEPELISAPDTPEGLDE